MPTYSAGSAAMPPIAVLLVSACAEDHDSLPRIFRGSRWAFRGARTASDGLRMIRRKHCEISVVICDHSLPDGGWKHLLTEMDAASVRPSLIVSSRLADERLWAEVLNLGAFDLLLGAPFEPEEVLRVTESAWRAWHRAGRHGGLARIGPGHARMLAPSVAPALAAGSTI